MSSSQVTLRRILHTTDHGFEEAVQCIADAFTSPTWLALMDNKRENLEADVRGMFLDCLQGGGELLFAELPDVGIVGAAAWHGPGIAFMATDEQRNVFRIEFMDRLLPETQALWGEYLIASEEARENIFGRGVPLAGYTLQLLGVDPKYHKSGAGGALVNYGLEKAKALGVPAMVETVGDPAIHFYQGCGFEVKGTAPMKGAEGEMMDFNFLMVPAPVKSA